MIYKIISKLAISTRTQIYILMCVQNKGQLLMCDVALHIFKGKIKIFMYVNIFVNLFQHLQLVNFSGLCVILMYVLSKLFPLQSVSYFHEQERRMGSYMKEKETHLRLSQCKFVNLILRKTLISKINSTCKVRAFPVNKAK